METITKKAFPKEYIFVKSVIYNGKKYENTTYNNENTKLISVKKVK